MMFIKKVKDGARRSIYFMGIKILSYRRKPTLRNEISLLAQELKTKLDGQQKSLFSQQAKLASDLDLTRASFVKEIVDLKELVNKEILGSEKEVKASFAKEIVDLKELVKGDILSNTEALKGDLSKDFDSKIKSLQVVSEEKLNLAKSEIQTNLANNINAIKATLFAEIKKRNPVSPNELRFYWDDAWHKYLDSHDVLALTQDLKQGLDKYSIEHIDMFLALVKMLPHKQGIYLRDGYGWTSKDAEYNANTQKFNTVHKLTPSEKFMFANQYGLVDIYDEVKDRINGKDIIDGGAYNGNTALLFSEIFQDSKIYSFEPMVETYNLLKNTIEEKNLGNRVDTVKKGLGHEESEMTIHFNNVLTPGATLTENRTHDYALFDTVSITTIDIFAKEKALDVGFIKLDIEGFEKKALEGAKDTIAKDKPVIIAALYHNPVDFFEIKNFLLKINPDYKFMIRRSERLIPLGDIVLIAY